MENQETPCNIKAAFSGQILRIEVYEGTAVAKVGEAVVEGQLLISGMVEDTNKNVTLIKMCIRDRHGTQRCKPRPPIIN